MVSEDTILSDLQGRLRGVEGVLSVGLRRGEEGSFLLLRARPGSPALSLPSSYRGIRLEKQII